MSPGVQCSTESPKGYRSFLYLATTVCCIPRVHAVLMTSSQVMNADGKTVWKWETTTLIWAKQQAKRTACNVRLLMSSFATASVHMCYNATIGMEVITHVTLATFHSKESSRHNAFASIMWENTGLQDACQCASPHCL